jgi:hypothetical protein
MAFGKDDFNPENAQRLSVIVMTKMGKPPLTPFKNLDPAVQKKFNRLMNEYIQALPDDYMSKLLEDFNQIVCEDIMTESWNPAIYDVPRGDKKLLLTDEQRELMEKGELKFTEEEIVLMNNEIRD